MWYELVLRDEIEDEVVEIASWFETRKEGEGIRFVLQFEKTISSIQAAPLRYMVSELGPRKARMVGFPYTIYFTLVDHLVTIRAIVHVRRNPDWVMSRFG